MTAKLISVVIFSYLLGAIPFGLLFAKLWGVDPRLRGSKNIGATNVLRTAGVLPAILTLIFDISKGAIAVLIAKALKTEPAWIAGLAAIIGHNFPLYLNFRGGKGVATSMGTIMMLYPPAGAAVTGIWLVVAVITRYSSLAALVSLGLCPIVFTVLKKSDMIGFGVSVAALAFMRHKDNLRRLLRGTEKKIGEKVFLLIFILSTLLTPLSVGAEVTVVEGEVPVAQTEVPIQEQRAEALVSISSLKENALDKGLRLPDEVIVFFLSKESDDLLRTPLFSSLENESPLIPFKKAEKAFKGGIKEALLTGIPYLVETFRASSSDLFWLINLGILFSSILITSLLLAFFIASITRLPIELPLLIHESTEKKSTALYLLIIIAGAITGLPYLAGALLLLMVMHTPTASQRLYISIYLCLLLLLPFVLRVEQGLLKILSDPEIKALSAVNERKDNKLILILKDPNSKEQSPFGTPNKELKSLNRKFEGQSPSKVYLFSRALALKREGKIDEAIEILKGLSTSPDYRVFNNLGNCLFLKGDLSGAEEYYQKAVELKKNPRTLYNLSQLYKERLDFEKGKNYYEEAMKLDAELISSFTKISSKAPNRFLMDTGLTTGELLRYSLQKALRYTRPVKIQEILLPLIFFGFLFVKFPATAYRCSRCGKVICNICQRRELWGRMCSDCYEVLVTPDRTDSKTRLQRLLFLQQKKSGQRKFFRVLSLFPGVCQTASGAMFQGLLILFLIGVSITSFIGSEYFFISMMKQFYLIWLSIFSGALAIIIHLLSLRRLSRIWP